MKSQVSVLDPMNQLRKRLTKQHLLYDIMLYDVACSYYVSDRFSSRRHVDEEVNEGKHMEEVEERVRVTFGHTDSPTKL